MTVQAIKVTYHHEGAVWWAEDFSGINLTAADPSLLETRRLVLEALAMTLGTDVFRVVEEFEDADGLQTPQGELVR